MTAENVKELMVLAEGIEQLAVAIRVVCDAACERLRAIAQEESVTLAWEEGQRQ